MLNLFLEKILTVFENREMLTQAILMAGEIYEEVFFLKERQSKRKKRKKKIERREKRKRRGDFREKE